MLQDLGLKSFGFRALFPRVLRLQPQHLKGLEDLGFWV